jgi:hypothetical protein
MVTGGNTQTSHIIPENGEPESGPLELGVTSTNKTDDGSNSEDGEREVVELFPPITPADRGKGFLGLEGMCDIVVGNVDVGWDRLSLCILGFCAGHGCRCPLECR